MTVAKGPDAFRTISEAATELGVPQHVLRFWESKFSFIRPMKRAGGRRFYRRQDIDVLRGVRTLLHDEGYTIKGVQRLHKEQGVRRLMEAAGSGAEYVHDEDASPSVEAAAPIFTPPPPQPSAVSAPLSVPQSAPQAAQVTAPPLPPELSFAKAPVLTPVARARLTTVLGDLESVKARIDRLLAHG